VSTGGPDLFVICKSCGSEVSPYITECPYCGSRLRKRAPRIDREGRISERRRRRSSGSSLPRLRRGEIPGIRAEARPYASLALVALGLVGCLIWRPGVVGLDKLAIAGKPGHEWWKLLTAPFTYINNWYALAALGAIMLFGWLLERRHGPLPVLALFLVGGVGGALATVGADAHPVMLGGNGAALALLTAWALPDLLELRSGNEVEGDLIGVGVIAVVIALLPLATTEASWVADGVGLLAGLALGYPLARLDPR
jgi:membrane associated rhomboid family serine protease